MWIMISAWNALIPCLAYLHFTACIPFSGKGRVGVAIKYPLVIRSHAWHNVLDPPLEAQLEWELRCDVSATISCRCSKPNYSQMKSARLGLEVLLYINQPFFLLESGGILSASEQPLPFAFCVLAILSISFSWFSFTSPFQPAYFANVLYLFCPERSFDHLVLSVPFLLLLHFWASEIIVMPTHWLCASYTVLLLAEMHISFLPHPTHVLPLCRSDVILLNFK